jgi:hypothetical protein
MILRWRKMLLKISSRIFVRGVPYPKPDTVVEEGGRPDTLIFLAHIPGR